MTEQQQQPTLIQQIVQFITQFNSNPFEDFYISFVFRLLIYVYVFILLSNILMGYERPSVNARVHKKFQIVYGGEVWREMEKEDIEDLEVTIKNTIVNATKEMKGKKLNHNQDGQSQQTIKNSINQSQRRSLRVDQTSDILTSSFKKRPSRLKFDLLKNEYFDPPVNKFQKPSNQKLPINQKFKGLEELNDHQIEGESEEQELSPTSRFSKKMATYSQNKSLEQIQDEINQRRPEQADIHYPEDELNPKNVDDCEQTQNQYVANETLSTNMIENNNFHHIDT